MWVALAVIVGVICMMVGPIMMMKPSARDARLASLRTSAAQKGFRVYMDTLPAEAIKNEAVAVYSIHYSQQEHDTLSRKKPASLMLFRQKYSHEGHFLGVWDGDDKHLPTSLMAPAMIGLLERFPAEIIGVVANKSSVGLYWTERRFSDSHEQDLVSIQAWLEELKSLMMGDQSALM